MERRNANRQWMANIALGLMTGVFALLVAEFAVGYLVTIRNVGPSFSTHHPEFFKHLKTNFSTVRTTPEFTMTISTNKFGFRGPPMEELPKDAILFLGDSFTMGYGVNDGEEYPAIITAKLRAGTASAQPVPVINAGIGGSGNGRWIKILRAMGDKIQPRLVVMQVLDNDFYDNPGENLFRLDDKTGKLVELPVPEIGIKRKIQRTIEAVPGLASSNLIGLLRQVRFDFAPTDGAAAQTVPSNDELSPQDRLTPAIVRSAIQYSQEKGWPVLAMNVGLTGKRLRAMRDLYRELGVDFIDLPTKAARPELYYAVDGHWNAAGHQQAARRLMDEFQRLGIIAR